MSLDKCITNAEADGTITKEQADRARDLFGDLQTQYKEVMGDAEAAAKAAGDTFDALKFEAKERKRRKLIQINKWQEIQKNLDEYRNAKGEVDYGRAALAFFEQDQLSKYSSIVQREAAVERSATRKLYQVLATFRRNLIGETRNKAELDDMVREIFEPGSTKSASAREMAQAWADTADYLRRRFNAAGGHIPNRKDWGMPQQHNTLEIRKAGYQAWRDYILPRLDTSRMVDESTGLPFTPDRLEIALNDVFETIRTDGMNKLKPGSMRQGASLANRRADHRFLVFKNADSWLDYQKKFGNDNAFDVMFGHIKNMSRDISQLEILGPNPRATVEFLKGTIKKQAGLAGDEAMENAATKTARQLDILYNAVTNNVNAPIDGKIAASMAGLRQVLQSAQLGAAAISAITDVNFQRIARQMSGLPQVGILGDYLKQLTPLGLEEKGKLAIRLGLIAEGWSSLASAQMRYVGDIAGPEITRRVADFVMRASLLSPVTQAGRWAFGMEFMGTMADSIGKRFDELHPNMQQTFKRYGLNENHWDIMRNSPLYEHEGASFLRAEDIEFRTDLNPTVAKNLATRYMEMIETETNFAVPSTSVRGRTALIGDTQPGTLIGELGRSFAMYKNFGVTLVNTHVARGLNLKGINKGKYFANLVISTSIMGALAIQLKEMSKGRDPRPMTDPAFWTAAFLQGGGLGIYGDFLVADVNRFDRGLSETIAGPVVGFANDVKNLTVGNLIEAANGEDTNVARETIKFVSRYTPGSSIWYLRLGLERMITDQLQLMADPKAPRNFRRLEKRYQREYGQSYWWRPGQTAPERAPKLESATKKAP